MSKDCKNMKFEKKGGTKRKELLRPFFTKRGTFSKQKKAHALGRGLNVLRVLKPQTSKREKREMCKRVN